MPYSDILRVVSGPSCGRQVPLTGRIDVGRSEAGLRIDDPAASRAHAVVHADAEGVAVTVADAGSARGTTLDGAPVTTPTPLPVGGTLVVGKSEVRRLRVVRHTSDDGIAVTLFGPHGEAGRYTIVARLTAGRDVDNDITVDDPEVSRQHLVLERRDDAVLVKDTGSRGGVLLNGRRIDRVALARAGDEIDFGGTAWTLQVAASRADQTPGEFRVRLEGDAPRWPLRIDADPASTVGEVAWAVAEALGAEIPQGATLYRDDDGIVLHPDDLWSAMPLRRGEVLVLAAVAMPAAGAAADPRRARSSVILPGSRAVVPPGVTTFDAPQPPETASLRGRGLGWQLGGAALGVGSGLVIALATGNPLFAIIGGLAGVGSALFGVLGDQSRRKHRIEEFARAVAGLEQRAGAAMAGQAEAWRRLCPLPADGPPQSGEVWERTPGDVDFLRLRLGIGDRLALVHVNRPKREVAIEVESLWEGLVAERLVRAVPLQTPPGGVLGITGPNRAVDALLRSMVLDAAIHHPPSALAIHVLPDAGEADALLWLPHLADGAQLRLTPGARAAGLGDRIAADLDSGRRVLVVVRPGTASAWAGLLDGWRPEQGLFVIAATDARMLPRQASAWIDVAMTAQGVAARLEGAYADGPVGLFVPDQLDYDRAAELALLMAPLRDAHASQASLFVSRTLLELSGARTPAGIGIGDNWRHGYGRLNAVLGMTDAGLPAEVELRHTVIAGTTGTGKSELLATMLASLIARQSPEELNLFLIDFKGGATFNRFAAAPHVVGVVTDLESDERLARRAFQALDVELRRRKRLLGDLRVNDIDRYHELGTGEPLPTLLVVIDEFALLAQTLPDVKERLDTIVAQGRSLGIFLVLATQSPAGVVTTAIRANTDLWLSLRVVSEQESREVLGVPDAARLPVDAPGRALARRGAETSLTAFQTARVTVATAATGSALVTVQSFGAEPLPAQTKTGPSRIDDVDDDLDVLIAHVSDEVRLQRIARPSALWLPPLPAELFPDELPAAQPNGTLLVRLGLSDLVAQQRQPLYAVDLGVTGMLVTGAPRSGKSAVLRQIAADMAERYPPSQVHVYGLHADGALDDVAALPHVGGIVQVDDEERTLRLLDRLTALVEARRSAPRDVERAGIVLLVDDYPAVRESLERLRHGRAIEQLTALLVSGRPSGVHIVLATPQPMDVRMAALAGLGHRLLLRVVDRSDYQATSWRPQQGEEPPPLPGRGVTESGAEVQVAMVDPPRAVALSAAWSADGAPVPIRALPRRVRFGEVPRSSVPAMDAIGLGGREIGPALLDASPGAHLVVLGESGTGRSTALLTVARAHLLRLDARALVLAPRGGPLESLAGHPGATVYGAGAAEALLADAAAAPTGTLLVIDDADAWPSSAADGLERMLRQGRDLGLRAAVAARAGDWPRLFDGWIRYLGSLKSALLLSGFGDVGPLFDVRLEPVSNPAPGRGYLIARGGVDLVQIADSAPTAREGAER